MSSNAQLDLLLVNPGGRTSVYQGLGSQLTAVEPPVWAGLIATFARGHGYKTDILDANALDLA
ncbi:MAG: B12-binding domain-containing radical SAM protein, partial [Candidatus Hydrogenedentes bacterium]|nr:B12-binding domain-containing radical SAM protein [Candidatus Hydrogenedentota bacterium]